MLGISGGIAAYKSAVLARRLIDAGAEVRVVMTEGAQAFITPLTLQALTGQPVHTDLLDPAAEAAMGHIELARWADRIIIAPASANTLARLAHGFASDLLATLVLASSAPLMVAPAMNRQMWAHPATQANLALLTTRGVQVAGPASGLQACGETGAGRMLEPEAIRDVVIEQVATLSSPVSSQPSSTLPAAASSPRESLPQSRQESSQASSQRSPQAKTHSASTGGLFDGLNITITAGPTHEAIDPVRFLGNRSSGRMGFALAAVAAARGARVTLVSGPVSLDTPANTDRIDVVSARDMHAAALAAVNGVTTGKPADIFIAVAAVADFRVKDVAAQKIKKHDIEQRPGDTDGVDVSERDIAGPTIELIRNPDILADVAALADAPFCVGFAAETESVKVNARAKLERKQLDMIAANRVAQPGHEVFGSDTNTLDVFWPPDGHARVNTAAKSQVAEQLLDLIAIRYRETKTATQSGASTERARSKQVTAANDPET